MSNKTDENKKVSVGGQALMEGIMMTGPKGVAMSLRLPDGSIETQMKKNVYLRDKYKFARIPFIRGPINFVEQLIFGYKCLMESAEKTTLEPAMDEAEDMSKLDRWITEHFGEKMMVVIGAVSAVFGIALAFLLFMYLPSLIADGINSLVKANLDAWRPAIEGIIRAAVLVLYMYLVSLMKDINRLFKYHGAEHKSIFCFESGEELTVENVRKQSRFHPRCGTSFMFLMIILSIIVSSIVAIAFPALRESRIVWMFVKILMLPFLMGVGYEFIKFAGRHDNLFTRIISAPGLWMQRITTKEPDDDIIEVGIEAIKAALGITDPTKKEDAAEIVMPVDLDESTDE